MGEMNQWLECPCIVCVQDVCGLIISCCVISLYFTIMCVCSIASGKLQQVLNKGRGYITAKRMIRAIVNFRQDMSSDSRREILNHLPDNEKYAQHNAQHTRESQTNRLHILKVKLEIKFRENTIILRGQLILQSFQFSVVVLCNTHSITCSYLNTCYALRLQSSGREKGFLLSRHILYYNHASRESLACGHKRDFWPLCLC